MKRKSWLKRNKPMRRVSKKREVEQSAYRGQMRLYLATHTECQMPSETGDETCGRPSQWVHHMKGRAGPLLCDTRYWLAVCDPCHKYIEDHKKWARTKKLIQY